MCGCKSGRWGRQNRDQGPDINGGGKPRDAQGGQQQVNRAPSFLEAGWLQEDRGSDSKPSATSPAHARALQLPRLRICQQLWRQHHRRTALGSLPQQPSPQLPASLEQAVQVGRSHSNEHPSQHPGMTSSGSDSSAFQWSFVRTMRGTAPQGSDGTSLQCTRPWKPMDQGLEDACSPWDGEWMTRATSLSAFPFIHWRRNALVSQCSCRTHRGQRSAGGLPCMWRSAGVGHS